MLDEHTLIQDLFSFRALPHLARGVRRLGQVMQHIKTPSAIDTGEPHYILSLEELRQFTIIRYQKQNGSIDYSVLLHRGTGKTQCPRGLGEGNYELIIKIMADAGLPMQVEMRPTERPTKK